MVQNLWFNGLLALVMAVVMHFKFMVPMGYPRRKIFIFIPKKNIEYFQWILEITGLGWITVSILFRVINPTINHTFWIYFLSVLAFVGPPLIPIIGLRVITLFHKKE
jgi:hypothetical protein